MKITSEIAAILDQAQAGDAPSRAQCERLLGLPANSAEAAMTRAIADQVSRRRFDGTGYLAGQVGLEVAPCPANCGFCAFGSNFTQFKPHQLSNEEITQRVADFVAGGDLHTLYLMTMHQFKSDRLLDVLSRTRRMCPPTTEIVVNIGDFDLSQARQMKAAGADGAYHVCRLGEGVDTRLDPIRRKQTLATIRDAGLRLHTCCEPIGPEHTPAQLVEQMFSGIEHGCYSHAAMRRVPVPGSPLFGRGQISELRLAQVVAVVALATLEVEGMAGIGVHEPNVLALVSGATSICAETGANPRDTAADTSGHRGRSVEDCRQLLREAEFDAIVGADGSRISLTTETQVQTA